MHRLSKLCIDKYRFLELAEDKSGPCNRTTVDFEACFSCLSCFCIMIVCVIIGFVDARERLPL